MENTGDKELLEKLARDDGDALKELFNRHFALLARMGTRLCYDQQEGKDVAQKVFIALWEKRHAIAIDGELFPYLKRMVINEALGRKRTEARREAIRADIEPNTSMEPEGEQQLIAEETQRRIRSAVDQLPEKSKEVFVLSRYEEMSYKEISDNLDISLKTVEYHMGKALNTLRKVLRPGPD